MRSNRITLLTCLLLLGAAVPQARASYCGLDYVKAGRCHAKKRGCCKAPCPYRCHTVMKTVTKTIYEQVSETKHDTVYDTVYDEQTVQDVDRIAETNYRQEEFTYQMPVYDSQTREVPYTVHWPVYETRTREVSFTDYVPAYETRKRSIPYTTYRTVEEPRTRTISYVVPRQVSYQKTIQVESGHWEQRMEERPGPVRHKCVQDPGCWQWDACRCRCVYIPGPCRTIEIQCPPIKCSQRIWVPSLESRVITCYETIYDTRTKQVPYTVTRVIPETHTNVVEYTVTRLVAVPRTRTVHYQVARMMSEQRFKTVAYTSQRMVTEVGTRSVPFTTYREVPITRTVSVPRQVPRTVTYTVTRCVPRQITCQIPVRICCPDPGCDSQAPGCGCDVNPAAEPRSYEPTPAPEPEMEMETSAQAAPASSVLPAALERQPSGAASPDRPFSTGLHHYWEGRFAEAAVEFEMAHMAKPGDAKFAYFRALALYQAGDRDAANQALVTALEVEKESPVEGWGSIMQRIQGRPRIWLEDARAAASTAPDNRL